MKSKKINTDKWKLISQKDLLNLQTNITEEMGNAVCNWLDLAWDNSDKSQGLTLLEQKSRGWVQEYPEHWENTKDLLKEYRQNLYRMREDLDCPKKEVDREEKQIESQIVGTCRGHDLLGMSGLSYCHFNSTIIDSLLKLQGKRPIDYPKNSSARLAKTTKALLSIQDYLNPDFMMAWPKFLQYAKFLVSEGVYDHAGDAVTDFIDHCVAWSLVLNVPYLRLLPRERTWWFNEVYLTEVYFNKHRVEEWAGHYINSESFILGFHKWCKLHDLIPEILWETEARKPENSRVRIQE